MCKTYFPNWETKFVYEFNLYRYLVVMESIQ